MKTFAVRKIRKYIFTALWLLAAVLICSCSAIGITAGKKDSGAAAPESIAPEDVGLTVTFFDVGQGNAVLAESDGHYMLIDGGPSDKSSFVVSSLKKRGIKKLDYIIATHYDADHISGLIGALHVFDTDMCLVPGYEADTRTYESFMKGVQENGCEVHTAAWNETFSLGQASFTVAAPFTYDHEEENDNSIAVRLEYQLTSFLFTGDAGAASEEEMINDGAFLDSDVLMVSHHGSSSATTEDFLEEVSPQYAVISVGTDNDYGHPAERVLDRLYDRDISVFRTDMQGTLTAVSDGAGIAFDAVPVPQEGFVQERQPETAAEYKYIGNVHSFKYHRLDCRTLPEEHNRVYFQSKEEAEDAGYKPCGNCKP